MNDGARLLLNCIDWAVPPREGEPQETRRQGRLLAAAVLLGVVILTINTLSDLVLGSSLRLLAINVLCSRTVLHDGTFFGLSDSARPHRWSLPVPRSRPQPRRQRHNPGPPSRTRRVR